jgi:hypothetical protein
MISPRTRVITATRAGGRGGGVYLCASAEAHTVVAAAAAGCGCAQYNLLDGCKRYFHDADIELFSKVMSGLLSEQVVKMQAKMLAHIKKELETMSTDEMTGKPRKGVPSKAQVIACVQAECPFYSDEVRVRRTHATRLPLPPPVSQCRRVRRGATPLPSHTHTQREVEREVEREVV